MMRRATKIRSNKWFLELGGFDRIFRAQGTQKYTTVDRHSRRTASSMVRPFRVEGTRNPEGKL